jgi:acyl-CoA synthetase (AMP-forming)/AMP-acid ligase II
MLGYIDDSASTAEAFDGSGWLRTGDVGHVTHGKVYIVDRKKDLIKVRGWQVSPAEVENVIQQHPLIADAAVIGVSVADNTREVTKAYIILRPGASLEPEAIRIWVGEKLAKYKIPEEIEFTRAIPKNPTGKVLRRVLREQEQQQQQQQEEESVAPLRKTEMDRVSGLGESSTEPEPLYLRIKGRILMGIAACAVYIGYLFFWT